jgi:hypothetical protein
MASGPNLLMNMFGRPRGIIGRLGGVIMARMNADCGVWVAGLLEVTPDDAVSGRVRACAPRRDPGRSTQA